MSVSNNFYGIKTKYLPVCVCVCVCACVRCVLLFRPPRLNNKFEDSVVIFTDYLTVGSLRRFIRDHL